MPISAKAMELENQSIGANGAPTLAAAYELLREQWESGERDRELALHLNFLAWYLIIEPSHLTGLDEARISSESLVAVFNTVHDWLLPNGTDTNDAEALYVVGLPARMFPGMFGHHDLWASPKAFRKVLVKDSDKGFSRWSPGIFRPGKGCPGKIVGWIHESCDDHEPDS